MMVQLHVRQRLSAFLLSALAIGMVGIVGRGAQAQATATPTPAAQTTATLSLNSGDTSESWFISGEPSLVMNGFDLNALGVGLPATITRASISVETPVPGSTIDVVVYQDANGGSPVDATVAGRTTVDITTAGVFTATFPTPITVNQPAVWVGFYLPVNFSFFADTSGTSVLTYWAWTPGGRFDVALLNTAQVLGPSNGTSPVNINLNGKARISVEVTGGAGMVLPAGMPVASGQTQGAVNADLSVLTPFPTCANVLYDTADERVTWRERIDVLCNPVQSWQGPLAPAGYVRQGNVYDIFFFQQFGVVLGGRLDFPVTHCIQPDAQYLSTALIGLAYGSPRQWRILPTQQFGNYVCAEVRYGGNLAYFTPSGTTLPTAAPG